MLKNKKNPLFWYQSTKLKCVCVCVWFVEMAGNELPTVNSFWNFEFIEFMGNFITILFSLLCFIVWTRWILQDASRTNLKSFHNFAFLSYLITFPFLLFRCTSISLFQLFRKRSRNTVFHYFLSSLVREIGYFSRKPLKIMIFIYYYILYILFVFLLLLLLSILFTFFLFSSSYSSSSSFVIIMFSFNFCSSLL